MEGGKIQQKLAHYTLLALQSHLLNFFQASSRFCKYSSEIFPVISMSSR